MTNFKPTWLMIKRHNKTGLKYFCKTVKLCPYSYNGSGKRWTNHLKVHGKDIETLWCKLFTDVAELTEYAIRFSTENNIVESDEWANLIVENGITGWPPGTKHREESKVKCRHDKGFQKGYTPHNSGKPNSPEHYAKQIEGMKKFRETNPDKYAELIDNLKPTPEKEKKRIAGIKEKLSGSNNVNYDPTIYKFRNKKTHEILNITRNELITKYGCAAQNVYKMIKGSRKSVNGWQLVKL